MGEFEKEKPPTLKDDETQKWCGDGYDDELKA